MLQSIREKSQGWIAWVIVGLIIITFALFGIDQYAQLEKTVVVAEVNGDEITGNEFISLYNRQKQRLQSQFGDMYDQIVDDKELRSQVLDSLIESKVIQQWAESNNMFVSDAQLARAIQSADVFHKDGIFDEATYQSVLARNGLSAARFEYEQRQFLAEQQFRQITATSAFSTDTQLELLARLLFQERKLSYLRIDQRPLAKMVEVSEEQIASFYDNNQADFVIPEKITLDYLLLSQDNLAKKVIITEDDLQDYYEDNKNEFTLAERRQASHILIRIDAPAQEESALKEITEIQAKLAEGASFETLARERSQDPGSASLGGDLGMFQQGMMVTEFDNAVFSMEIGQVSEPIKTDFGYHLIKLVAIEEKSTKPFEDVKATVEEQFRLRAAEKQYFDLLEQLSTITYEQSDSLVPAADAIGVEIQTTQPFSRQGGEGEVASNSKVLAAAFSEDVKKRGMNSPVIELTPTSSVVVRINTVIDAQQKELADVASEIAKEIQRQAGVKASSDLAKEILAKVQTGEATLDDLVKEGVELKVLGWLNRENRQVLPEVTQALFKAPKPEDTPSYVVATLPTGDSLVLEISAVKEGKLPEEAGLKSQLLTAVEQVLATSEMDARVGALIEQADIDKKAVYQTIK